MERSHWVEWHQAYEDPDSFLSVRLRLVQEGVRARLNAMGPGPGPGPGPIRVVSLCAGQGRDVIDVLATHPRSGDAQALLVELDPALCAFARDRAAAAGLAGVVRVVEGDASDARHYADMVPADLVLVCGLFGNISDEDVSGVVAALPSFCTRGGEVIWTRHRRPPDLTPAIRGWFDAAGFEEVSFAAPPHPYVLSVGRQRWMGATHPFDHTARLFHFVGDGLHPA
jgi:putative methyltransferase